MVPEGAEQIPPPEISPGQTLDWSETLQIVSRIDEQISAGSGGAFQRLVRAIKLVELIGQTRFAKIRGPRLDEFLEIVSAAAEGESPDDLSSVPEPSPVGRMQFRLLCAQYARRDTFADQEAGWRNRWRLFRTALRFTRGTGLVPPLQPEFAAVPFADLERPFGTLPPEVDEMLIRYLRVKLQGLHFCGRAYYNVPLVEGFQSLALVVPVVLWLARWLAAGQGRRQLNFDDVLRALNIADHHHGYSPAFGQSGFRGRVRLLARLDDISKLAAWYGR